MSDIEAEIRRQMLEERRYKALMSAPPNPDAVSLLDTNSSVPSAQTYSALSASPPVVPPLPATPAPVVPPLPPAAPSAENAPGASGKPRKGLLGIWAIILSVAVKLKSLLFLAKFATFSKLILTGGSMAISMWAWSLRFGWKFAVGFVLLIFIHECGHALAARRLGHPIGIMVFIPFMGAFVTSRGGRSLVEDAYVGIMGPVFGTLGGCVCCLIYLLTRYPFWLALAAVNFQVNLFNLAPTAPLDGGWISPIFSPKLLLPGLILLALLFHSNALIWVLAFLSLPRIIGGWQQSAPSQFYAVGPRDRLIYGLAWAGLAAFLALATNLIHNHFAALRHIVA